VIVFFTGAVSSSRGGLDVFAGADFAFDLHVSAFGEGSGILAGASEGHSAVPRNFMFVFTGFGVFPAAIGRQRQNRERRLIFADMTHFRIFA
jgi:hypothetical protein